MKLLHLTTKNFKRLGSGEFQFTDGVNFVVGPNAAGKSTLLRAVSVSLFGVAALPGVAGDVATWGTSSWGLHLEFEHAGVTYRVTRDHKTAKVEANGEMVANGNRPSTQYLETLLNRSMKDFNLLTNSRQGETTYALNYGAAALQRDVERLSGADTIEKIIGAAKALRAKLDAEVTIEGDYLLSEAEVTALEQKMQDAKADVFTAGTHIEDADRVLAKPAPATPSVGSLQQVRKAREAYVRFEADMGNYRKAKAALETQVAEAGPEVPEDDALLTQYKGEVSVLVASKRQWERACDEGRSLERQIADIVIPEGDFEGALADAKKDLTQHEAAEAAVEAMVTEKRAEIRHFEKHIKDGVCSACGTVLSGDVDDVKIKLAEAKQQLAPMQDQLSGHHDLVTSTRESVAELNANIAVQAERIAQKAKLERRLAELDFGPWRETDEEALQVAERNMSAAAEALHSAEAHNKARRKLVDQLDRLRAPEVVPEVTEADVSTVETTWSEYQQAQSAWQVEQAAAKAKRAAGLEAIKAAESAYNEASKRLNKHQQTISAISGKKQKSELAARLSEFLRDRREFYLTKVWDVVLGSATQFLATSSEGWMTGMSMKDGSFLFEGENGAWAPAVEASGAQAAFLGVALRVGLSQALDRDRSLMILDEPTEAMREDNARRLMAGVGAARDQVIVVTHRTTDQGLADNLITIEGNT